MPRYFQESEAETSAVDKRVSQEQHKEPSKVMKKKIPGKTSVKNAKFSDSQGCKKEIRESWEKSNLLKLSNINRKEEMGKSWQKGHVRSDKLKDIDPYPGRPEVAPEKLKQYSRGEGLHQKAPLTRYKQIEFQKREERIKFSVEQSARAEMLLTEDCGYLEADEGEHTSDFTQKQIADAVDITSASKHFNLVLNQFGPYSMDYNRSGRFLVIGGRKGHVAAMDWMTKKLMCEINVMESVHVVRWLHVETMFAVAQKKWTYIYDNQGIELHCIKKLNRVLQMEFLPYHFLLATSNESGYLIWLDISIGKIISNFSTKMGRLDLMCQNPYNAVLCLGHPKGTVTMWTPSMQEPVATVLCHHQPITAITVDPSGMYMVTASIDRTVKIWDVRNYRCLQACKMRNCASKVAFSQRRLLAVAAGDVVQLYNDWDIKTLRKPYLRYTDGNAVSEMQFCPYEDVLGLSHSNGFTSMLVPGAGEPNFDAMESNPFQTKSQRKESEVKALLEKIQPELISLDPGDIADVDVPTLKEKNEARQKLLFIKAPKIDFTPRNKAKMKGGSVKQAQIKKGVIEQKKKEYVKETMKKRKQLQQAEEAAAPEPNPEQPKHVLDRFRHFQQKKT